MAIVTDLLIVVGARPNFMKADAIVRAAKSAGLAYCLLHTGQHYDSELSQVFLDELGLPEPDVYLGVGSGTHAEQTARIMLGFERELRRIDPQIVVVVGDVNSTLAAALVASKEGYPVAHVEAGLRSYDLRMPEEINRRLCDHLSNYLYATSRDAVENLLGEGIPAERVVFAGNTMIDTLLRLRDSARQRETPSRFGLTSGEYAVATLHRPENVDDPDFLRRLLEALAEIGRRLPVVFPIHPRTRERMAALGLAEARSGDRRVITSDALGYLDFVGLVADASLVLTDSGGVQEEATVLGIPCLTVRETTERPVTVTSGTNKVIGRDPERLVREVDATLAGAAVPAGLPERWDGRAGERIVGHLAAELAERSSTASHRG
jgi:UDP-N-acetylglucosamine 2-epimerase (non-hydrolysing)